MRLLISLITALLCLPANAQNYDIVLAGGTVMDPETGLDAVRWVGINGDRITAVSTTPLEGTQTIDVSGLVVAPGFIDLHAHGQTNAANQYQARDGVTTALEMESGVPQIGSWIAKRRGKALINYGATASQTTARALAMVKYAGAMQEYQALVEAHGEDSLAAAAYIRQNLGASVYAPLLPGRYGHMDAVLRAELEAGALGIGLPVGYQPGSTWGEILHLFRFAADRDVTIYVHVRDPGINGIQEMIANAAVTGGSVHIVHINSMALGHIQHGIDLVEAAQQQGLDVTTELYPYTAGSTSLESALFDAGWQSRMNITFDDLQWQDTGERLTAASFETYRDQGGVVIIHMMKEDWIEEGIARDVVMIGSDGMPYAPGAHPRSAGTFARVLGRYVREKGALDLMSALTKMTLQPALRLEKIAPAARRKGRLQAGADADITVFNPDTVIDTATFTSGLSFSTGIEYVMVNGQLVVADGESVTDVYPGRPLLGRYFTGAADAD